MQQWIYKGQSPDIESKVIDTDELDTYKADGWRESFRQPGEGETPLALPPDTPVELEGDDLKAQAKALGIKVDGRWKEERLLLEIVKARESLALPS